MSNPFTADERSFPKPKSRAAGLIAYKAAADVAAKLSLFAITVVAARRLTPAAFGTFALGSTIGWMAAVAGDAGLQMHVARAVARAPGASRPLLDTWLRLRLWTALGALLLATAGVVAARTGVVSGAAIVLLALVYAVNGVIEFLHHFYRGMSRSDVESTLTIWQRAATLVCGVVALLWRRDVSTLAIAMLIPAIVTLGVSLRRARSIARTDQEFVDLQALRPTAATLRRDVLPIGAGIVLSALYFRIDVFLVQLWSGTESVGLYNAVFRLIEGLRLFPAAALAVSLPAMCRARDLRPLAGASLGAFGFAVLVTAIVWPVADVVIPALFGEPYRAAVPAFRILLLTFPLLSLNYALTTQLIGWDRQLAYAAICASALVANIVMNVRLIPVMSIDGAAWATFGTEVVVTLGCAIALVRPTAARGVGTSVAQDFSPAINRLTA